MIQGKVGSKALEFKNTPRGKTGEAEAMIGGRAETVKWTRDGQGIWIETSRGYFGYDVRKTTNDDGQAQYMLFRRRHTEVVAGLGFLKAGEETLAGAAGKTKKGLKVKSQMPGKIVRVLVKAGDSVTKGQSLLVMEAMKMENEIKAQQDGVIQVVKVTEGQAVETGAELVLFS